MRITEPVWIVFLCLAMICFTGCTSPGNPSAPSVATPGPVSPSLAGSTGGTNQIFPCTIRAPEDPVKSQNLEIVHAEGQGLVRDIFYIRLKIQNKGSEGAYTGVSGKSCDLTTGQCFTDAGTSAAILKPYETVDFELVTTGGCPATGTGSTCTCEAWLSTFR